VLRRKGKRSLRERLLPILNHFNVQFDTKDLSFIKIRNKLVHEGRFPSNVDPVGEYTRFVNFIDRILLLILGYRGKYYLNRLNNYSREALS
jgi:hypothetical protein